MKTRNFLSMLGLTAMAASTAVSAQSSVSIYGILDASVAYAKGEQSKLGVRSGDFVASRIGFRGAEVINPDLKVMFNLEAALNLDTGMGGSTNTNNQASGATTTGPLVFNRHSWLGVETRWGELRLGRMFNPTYRQYLAYDPFMGGGPGASQAAQSSLATYGYSPAGIRHSNAIEYTLPRGIPFSGQLMYATGKNPSGTENRSNGNYLAGRLAYQLGEANFGVAVGKMRNSSLRDVNEVVAGAKYKIDNANLMAMYTRSKTGVGMHQEGWLLGTTLRHNQMEYRASLSTSSTKNNTDTVVGRSHKLAAVAAYHLSKRSSVYVLGTFTRNSHGASSPPLSMLTAAETGINHNARSLSVGVLHNF